MLPKVLARRVACQIGQCMHRMALGGTAADLKMLSSKPEHSSILVNEEQPSKAPSPMLVRPAGIAIDVIEEQPRKARTLMLVSPTGSSIDVKEEQRKKVPSSRLVRPVKMVAIRRDKSSIL